jgi:UDP-N-acetyl-alpha-D-muramoyl-L-alanyl-L-glutamate epimerase
MEVARTAGPPFARMPAQDRFRYDGYVVDPARRTMTCHYATAGHRFSEEFTFPDGQWDDPAVQAALRLLYLLAGVSYYKTSAPPVIDLGDLVSSAQEREFLCAYYVNGLAEFAYRNGLDLRHLRVEGPDGPTRAVPYQPACGRPLIPFGGGMDSIVTVGALAPEHPEAALFVVEPGGDRYAPLEAAAAVTGLPVVRAVRRIDPQVRRSAEEGFLNGHVPVTAILTAAGLVAATLERRDAVVLSNEWSASEPTLVADGLAVNHQWSKGDDFEQRFGELVAATLGPDIAVFSYLRPRSELWVAQRFASLPEYHGVFRSCNRAFHQDPARRLDHWCGRCDKCCFVDLVLAPFVDRSALAAVFDGHEPLDDDSNEDRFRGLLALGDGHKPFECVGDVDECRAAVLLASDRADRADRTDRRERTDHSLLTRLRDALGPPRPGTDVATLLEPRGPHRIPDRYAPADLLVRAR